MSVCEGGVPLQDLSPMCSAEGGTTKAVNVLCGQRNHADANNSGGWRAEAIAMRRGLLETPP